MAEKIPPPRVSPDTPKADARVIGHVAFHGNPAAGAASMAPTAPHATDLAAASTVSKAVGPERFWSPRPVRVALVVACAVSLGSHWLVAPWRLFPDRSGLEIHDPAGELTIPVELLAEEAPPVETNPPVASPVDLQPPSAEKDSDDARAKADASAPKPVIKAELDAGAKAVDVVDASKPETATDGGLFAFVGDAAAPSASSGSGPRDPGAMIGMPGLISAGVVNVSLLVNVAVIRRNAVGARMGPILQAIPQWADFMKGAETTIDPIRDTEWILIYGPSLIHTERDAVFVRYAISDALVDTAVDAIARRYDKGGAYDAGVPGVKASLGRADNAERVFLRGAPKTLVIVPKDKASLFARLAKVGISKKVDPDEAVRLVVNDPWKQISIPGLKFSNALKQLRLWVVPRATDGGADVSIEGDCTDEDAAIEVAGALSDLVRGFNSLGVRLASRGLLNNAKFTADGQVVKSHVSASQEQIQALLELIAATQGVDLQPPTP